MNGKQTVYSVLIFYSNPYLEILKTIQLNESKHTVLYPGGIYKFI